MRTRADFSDDRSLSDGTRVTLRHIRPADAGELRDAFERLSPESRHRRFFGGVTVLTDEALRYLTEVDGRDHVALVAVSETPDLKRERGLGVARFVRLATEPTVAEAAVLVVDDAQRRGVGRLLAQTLAEAARERGISTFRAEVLADNEPMRAILAEVGATAQSTEEDVITYDVPLGFIEGGDAPSSPLGRLLRVAASSMSILLRRLALPPGQAAER